jgi:hypothetical protein
MSSFSRFVNNALGGLRGRENVAAWIVAGGAAYYFFLRPQLIERKQNEERLLRTLEALAEREKQKELEQKSSDAVAKGADSV